MIPGKPKIIQREDRDINGNVVYLVYSGNNFNNELRGFILKSPLHGDYVYDPVLADYFVIKADQFIPKVIAYLNAHSQRIRDIKAQS